MKDFDDINTLQFVTHFKTDYLVHSTSRKAHYTNDKTSSLKMFTDSLHSAFCTYFLLITEIETEFPH